MKEKNFKDLSLANATMSLAKIVLNGIETGNAHRREVYACLCKIAGDDDTTDDETWNDNEKSFIEANGYLLQGYEDFKLLLFQNLNAESTKVVESLKGYEILFLETLGLAVDLWISFDFLDKEFFDFVQRLIQKVETDWSDENMVKLRHYYNMMKQEVPVKM